ncbi:MAG TPA: hypothetical protein VF641_03360, partial [Methylobacterium sp.]
MGRRGGRFILFVAIAGLAAGIGLLGLGDGSALIAELREAAGRSPSEGAKPEPAHLPAQRSTVEDGRTVVRLSEVERGRV